MSAGLVLAILLVVGMSLVYSGGIWLLTSRQSPLPRRWRAQRIDRTVRREAADLDRRIVELTRQMQRFD